MEYYVKVGNNYKNKKGGDCLPEKKAGGTTFMGEHGPYR